jgi:hypothetical protein
MYGCLDIYIGTAWKQPLASLHNQEFTAEIMTSPDVQHWHAIFLLKQHRHKLCLFYIKKVYVEKLVASGWHGEVGVWEADEQGHGFHLVRPTCLEEEAQVCVIAEFLGRP